MGLAPDVLPGYVATGDLSGRKAFEQQWGGALDLGEGLSAPEILRAAADGRIRALWIVGDHWLRSAPDRALAERAIQNCELLIVNEMFLTETASFADIVFPASAFAEKEGVVVNAERRLQRVARALSPRRGSRPDWEILQAVAQALGAKWNYRTAEDVFREIARLVPGYERLGWSSLVPLGIQWAFEARAALPAHVAAAAGGAEKGAGDGFWLLGGGTLFLQGSRGSRSSRARSSIRATLRDSRSQTARRSSCRAPAGDFPWARRSTIRCRRARCSFRIPIRAWSSTGSALRTVRVCASGSPACT
jgi:anaerobic selenocysteine-containing dehydrogenase